MTAMVVIIPAGASKLVLCHWDNSGHWESIEVNYNALGGHENHFDIWPPVEGVTPGHNWPEGEHVYLAGCVLTPTPSTSPSATATASVGPSPSASATASATATLPPTGPGEISILGQVALAVTLIATGAWLKWRRTPA